MYKPSCKSNWLHLLHPLFQQGDKKPHIIQKTTIALYKGKGGDGLGSCLPPHGEDTVSHLGGSHQWFAPPEPQQAKTSQIINSTSQEIQTHGIRYPPHYQINQQGGSRWHAPNLRPGTVRPLIYLTAILLAQPLHSNGAPSLMMRNYWAVCANCFPIMFHFQTPFLVSLFPFNPKWLSTRIQMICSFL